jgi:hypothetical protein
MYQEQKYLPLIMPTWEDVLDVFLRTADRPPMSGMIRQFLNLYHLPAKEILLARSTHVSITLIHCDSLPNGRARSDAFEVHRYSRYAVPQDIGCETGSHQADWRD